VSVYVPVELRKQVRLKFADRCAYCQTTEHLTPVTFEIEHIVPLSHGGETVLENLCLACPTCNRLKSDRTLAAVASSGQQSRLFHPHRDHWAEHFCWSDDATELIGLTEIGNATLSLLQINRPQYVRIRRMWVAMNEHPPSSL
jgi:HNH endonuclease